VVPLCGIDQSDVICFESTGFEKLVADCCACRATADDHDLVAASGA
jgi:hypothetical protein